MNCLALTHIEELLLRETKPIKMIGPNASKKTSEDVHC